MVATEVPPLLTVESESTDSDLTLETVFNVKSGLRRHRHGSGSDGGGAGASTGPVKLDCGRSSVANVNHAEKFARQTDPAVAADMGPRPEPGA